MTSSLTPLATSTPKKRWSSSTLDDEDRALSTPPRTIPSLDHPPQAPKRDRRPHYRPWLLDGLRLPFPIRSEAQRRRAMRRLRKEEREEYESWPIRSKYLMWTPLEVEQIEDMRMLEFLYEKYAFPSSQPRNRREEAFFGIMKETILNRLMILRSIPQ